MKFPIKAQKKTENHDSQSFTIGRDYWTFIIEHFTIK